MKHRNKLSVLILAALLMALPASMHAVGVANLRCEYLEYSPGIAVEKPRLTWMIESNHSVSGFVKTLMVEFRLGAKRCENRPPIQKKICWMQSGNSWLSLATDAAFYDVGSGTYHFQTAQSEAVKINAKELSR